MKTKKQLPAADALAAFEAAQSKTEGVKLSQMLRSCRLQFQNPATFEVTSVYLTRTDAADTALRCSRAASASWQGMRRRRLPRSITEG